MRIALALLPGGMNWRLRRGGPDLSELGSGWGLVNPLIPLSRRPQMIMLEDGDIMLLQHDVVHLSVPSSVDHDAVARRLEEMLPHLRLSTLDPRCSISVAGRELFEVSELPPQEGHDLRQERVRILRNRDKTATTIAKFVDAFGLAEGQRPSPHGTLALDAIAAVSQDSRKAILYAAFAVEVLASDILHRAYEQAMASSPPPSDFRIITRAVTKQQEVRKDPIYEQLQTASKRRLAILLHELPLYVMRRSLLQEDEALYNDALKLQETRNVLAHRGVTDTNARTFPDTVKGAEAALDVARRVFRWFGERDYFIAL